MYNKTELAKLSAAQNARGLIGDANDYNLAVIENRILLQQATEALLAANKALKESISKT